MQEMSRSDPQNHTKVLAAWVRERRKATAVREKVKFGVWEFAVSLQSREGARHEGRSRMMWRGYFLTLSQSEEGGSLSEAEAKQKWKEYESDPAIARDQKGPRGHLRRHLRLKVPMFEDVIEFKEGARQREITKSEKLNKKSMQENKDGARSLRMKMVLGAAGGNAMDIGEKNEWAEMEGKMKSSNFDGEIALQPQAEDIARDVQQKSRRSSGASRPPSSGSGSSESYASDEEASQDICCSNKYLASCVLACRVVLQFATARVQICLHLI